MDTRRSDDRSLRGSGGELCCVKGRVFKSELIATVSCNGGLDEFLVRNVLDGFGMEDAPQDFVVHASCFFPSHSYFTRLRLTVGSFWKSGWAVFLYTRTLLSCFEFIYWVGFASSAGSDVSPGGIDSWLLCSKFSKQSRVMTFMFEGLV